MLVQLHQMPLAGQSAKMTQENKKQPFALHFF
jgi:hypothetical protein